MSSVTYHHQPAINATRGSVPVAGNSIPYKVSKVLWPAEVADFIASQLVGFTLHVCCGKSRLGDVRLDMFQGGIDVRADMARLPFGSTTFDTVLCDPPYNSRFQVMHDMLNELHRVARKRCIFQHWFSPINKEGKFKKAHVFQLTEMVNVVEEVGGDEFSLTGMYNWMPRSYFGRMQIISIFDKVNDEEQTP